MLLSLSDSLRQQPAQSAPAVPDKARTATPKARLTVNAAEVPQAMRLDDLPEDIGESEPGVLHALRVGRGKRCRRFRRRAWNG
jgi:hypothetical protein